MLQEISRQGSQKTTYGVQIQHQSSISRKSNLSQSLNQLYPGFHDGSLDRLKRHLIHTAGNRPGSMFMTFSSHFNASLKITPICSRTSVFGVHLRISNMRMMKLTLHRGTIQQHKSNHCQNSFSGWSGNGLGFDQDLHIIIRRLFTNKFRLWFFPNYGGKFYPLKTILCTWFIVEYNFFESELVVKIQIISR